MNKKYLVSFLLLISVLVPVSVFAKPQVKVLSPNGGEVYKVGDTMTITWTPKAPGISGIYLRDADTRGLWNILALRSPNVKGSYSFEIPFNSTPGRYYVELYTHGGKGLVDVSDAPFTIIPDEFSEVPVLYALMPGSGTIGTQFTLVGNGFLPTGNTITFGDITITELPSFSDNGVPQYIIYTVPEHGNCVGAICEPINSGIYPMTVTNANGTSNTLHFTVTD